MLEKSLTAKATRYVDILGDVSKVSRKRPSISSLQRKKYGSYGNNSVDLDC